ncbi:saposin domain-containing protein [Streptomyces sp. RKAG293]|uniref:saposin domain-containing protein n=1 Tax=Streptomyces sp. RKAG293 TaxID=2893403 RepID=UPI002033475E|nr:saposin domain-containing protein [Streptomyces sp. RKAG293]MCM2416659.1 saposin domain-containing protein [Streptomyces sp. RKAG293]
MQHAKDYMTSTTTQAELEELLLGVVQQSGSDGLGPAWVRDNIEVIYHFLEDELDPHLICNALGLCE